MINETCVTAVNTSEPENTLSFCKTKTLNLITIVVFLIQKFSFQLKGLFQKLKFQQLIKQTHCQQDQVVLVCTCAKMKIGDLLLLLSFFLLLGITWYYDYSHSSSSLLNLPIKFLKDFIKFKLRKIKNFNDLDPHP